MDGHFHHDIIEVIWIGGIMIVVSFVLRTTAGWLVTRKGNAARTWGAAIASIVPAP